MLLYSQSLTQGDSTQELCKCNPGFFAVPTDGSTICTACESGTYKENISDTLCVACPARQREKTSNGVPGVWFRQAYPNGHSAWFPQRDPSGNFFGGQDGDASRLECWPPRLFCSTPSRSLGPRPRYPTLYMYLYMCVYIYMHMCVYGYFTCTYT